MDKKAGGIPRGKEAGISFRVQNESKFIRVVLPRGGRYPLVWTGKGIAVDTEVVIPKRDFSGFGLVLIFSFFFLKEKKVKEGVLISKNFGFSKKRQPPWRPTW